MKNRRISKTLLATALAVGIAPAAYAVHITAAADLMFVVDESGSMALEHAWIGSMVTDLEAGLTAAGIGTGANPNQYGMVGYANAPHDTAELPHKHQMSGADWGTASALSTEAGNLSSADPFSGLGTEDGYRAMKYALDNYSYRGADVTTAMVLISDEDRDVLTMQTYNDMLTQLQDAANEVILNVVVNCGFGDATGGGALGIDSHGHAYWADGSGGWFDTAGGAQVGSCLETTNSDYVNLALATGGAAWDLNILRAGGNDALSFTSAFIDHKVAEIPEPGVMLLLGSGILSMGFVRRRKSIVN